ncbi:MAG: sulfotransferase family 2 domain-containing protein [Patescibacteria group bacterium]|nr:sulfotransferase family 2 domain-containing protein [Patescibacteria group bacterium]
MPAKEPLYFFLHIPKTGGTTINQALASTYKNGEFIFLPSNILDEKASRKSIKNYLLNIPVAKKNLIKVIAGHDVYYGLHNIFPNREPRYIACFRHPVDLTISSYNYYLTITNKKDCNPTNIAKQPINDIKILNFQDVLTKYEELHNLTFKFLADRLLDNKRLNKHLNLKDVDYINTKNNDFILKKIKNILSHFYFLGITEKSQDDFLFIADKFGITKYMPKDNISTKFFNLSTNPTIKNAIEQYNLLDQNLYDYAVQVNNSYKKNNQNFNLRVKKINNMFTLGLIMDMFKITHYPQNIYRFSDWLKQKSNLYKKILAYFKNLH